MAISVGDKLPAASFPKIGADGPETEALSPRLEGRKVVIFGVPGAFSTTCDQAHMPSFIRAKEDLKAKGVEEIICVGVNDAFVMQAWGESTGAYEAGITVLADADGSFTRALGMEFDAPPVGFYGRSKRYAMYVEDGVVKVLNEEPTKGCTISGGEAMVEAI